MGFYKKYRKSLENAANDNFYRGIRIGFMIGFIVVGIIATLILTFAL